VNLGQTTSTQVDSSFEISQQNVDGEYTAGRHLNCCVCLVFVDNVRHLSTYFGTVGGWLKGSWLVQEAQLMLTTGSTRLAVNQGQQT